MYVNRLIALTLVKLIGIIRSGGNALRRTKEEAQGTRDDILDAAERVFFDRGVSRTSLEQVAREASVTRGAVYWHFRNKADLFNALVDRVRMPMENAFYEIVKTAETLEHLERLCTTNLLRIDHDKRLRRVYTVLLLRCEYTEDMTNMVERERATKRKVTAALTHFFEQLQKAGKMNTSIAPRTLALALYAYMLGLYTDYLRAPEQYHLEDDAKGLIGLFFAPLKSDVD